MLPLMLFVLAQAPLPNLVVEATDGGSAFVIRNTHSSHALTAYLIELVDYPGSSFAFSHDELAQGGTPLGAGQQRRFPVPNMTLGAAPDYVKIRAALYADGSASGSDDKVAQLRARRKLLLATIGEILAQPTNLKALRDAIPPSNPKSNRAAPDVVDRSSRLALINEAINLQTKSANALQDNFKARQAALGK